MSYQEDTVDWQIVAIVDEWLDTLIGEQYEGQPLAQDWARLSKIGEELGEAIQAFIGLTGQNPRKGISNTREEFLDEVADTIITGLFCLQHFTGNSAESKRIITEKMARIYKRAILKDNS